MLNNMSDDWRFKNSPHVKAEGGLQAYAGTPLIVNTEDQSEVVLGSLCVASDTPQEPLSLKQMQSLVRFADMLGWEITQRTRRLRLKARGLMTDTLLALHSQTERSEFTELLIRAIQQHYPDARVSIQDSAAGSIELHGSGSVHYSDVTNNLWEDTSFIDFTIRNSTYERRLGSPRTARAIVARCGQSDQYLVVTSQAIQHVFDDLDAWFIERCAASVADTLQKKQLLQALLAKEVFLRSLSHTLRTPIHGILGSAELLSEELALKERSDSVVETNFQGHRMSASSNYINAIRSSGRELMSTVNNLLMFNTLTTYPSPGRRRLVSYDLRELGRDILTKALQLVPHDQMQAVSIRVENNIAKEQTMIETDGRWLQDCLQPLLLNGLQSVLGSGRGIVTMFISYDVSTKALCFDFKDTGIGIKSVDQTRIFTAFEKVDDFTSGVGLGLTLARKIAERNDGSITLVRSVEGSGSHFQARFLHQHLSTSTGSMSDSINHPQHLPREFHEVQQGMRHAHMLLHLTDHLRNIGFEKCNDPAAGLVITDLDTFHNESDRLFGDRIAPTIVICYTDDRYKGDKVQQLSEYLTVITVVGPLHAFRIDNILLKADLLYAEMFRSVSEISGTPTPSESEGDPLSAITSRTTPDSSSPSLEQYWPSASPDVGEKGDSSDGNSESTVARARLSDLRALLVDDNAINLRILEMFCQKRKFPYIVAQDGFQAEAEYRKSLTTPQPFNLILMDLQMPKCDGLQATTAIRAIEGDQCLPRSAIFMITGQDSVADKVQSEQAGSDEYLVKPVSLKVLHQHIRKYFKGNAKDLR